MKAENVEISDFYQLDMRVGTILSAELFPEARKPAYKLKVDFGLRIGIKKSSAQVTERYTLDGLMGMQVVAVINLPPRQIGNFMSEVLVLGFPDDNGAVCLATVDSPVPNGSRLF